MIIYNDRFFPHINSDNFYGIHLPQQTPQQKLASYMETGENPYTTNKKVLSYKRKLPSSSNTLSPSILNKIFNEMADRPLAPYSRSPGLLHPTYTLHVQHTTPSIDCSHAMWIVDQQLITLRNQLLLMTETKDEAYCLYNGSPDQEIFSPCFVDYNTKASFLMHNNQATELVVIDIEKNEITKIRKIADHSFHRGRVCLIDNTTLLTAVNRDLFILDTRTPLRGEMRGATEHKIHALTTNPQKDYDILMGEQNTGLLRKWDLRKFNSGEASFLSYSCFDKGGTIHSIVHHPSKVNLVALTNISGSPAISIWDTNKEETLCTKKTKNPLTSLCWSSPEYQELLGVEAISEPNSEANEGPNSGEGMKIWPYDSRFHIYEEKKLTHREEDVLAVYTSPTNRSIMSIHESPVIKIWRDIWPENESNRPEKRQRIQRNTIR